MRPSRGAATVAAVGLVAICAAACGSTGDVPAPAGGEPKDPPARVAPTWFRDVEPIVQRDCAGCHTRNGTGGFALDRETSRLLANLIAERVTARDMPPWPPGRDGARLVGERALDDAEIAMIAAWAAAGAPEGDPAAHVDRAPRIATPAPARPSDLRLALADPRGYREPASAFVTDEVRCFVLDLPAGSPGVWVDAARWIAGTPVGIHQLGGVVVDADAATVARSRSGRDGRAGFECAGGLGDITRGPALGANGSGGPGSEATIAPRGTAVRIPRGGAVIMSVHYAVKHLAGASDRSGVELWLAPESEHPRLRPLLSTSVAAPVEVPCPSGLSTDPSDACSRDGAFARLALGDAARVKEREDALLAACQTSVDALIGAAMSGATKPGGDHFHASTSCARVAPWAGTIRVVHAKMQTRGATVRVEAEQRDGSWTTVLDVPRWRWAWDGAYVLESGVPVEAGRRLRVSCTFDNGPAAQWSALTGEPGHNAPARPPRLAPGYLVPAPHRAAEACEAWVAIERTPHAGTSWPSICHEAEAVHAATCGAGKIDLTSRGCGPDDIDAAVGVLGAPAPRCP